LAIRQYDWSAHAAWGDGSADSGDWVTELIDLAAYAGDTVTVRLRLITGGPQSADGWYIDNVYLGPADVPDSASTMTRERWSLLSVPVKPATERLDSLFPAAMAAFRYQNGYVAAESLRHGAGYWIRFEAPDTTLLSGDALAADTIMLRRGWNLVGSITTPLDTARTLTLPPGIRTSSFFGFDTQYVEAPTLEPGRGYWVRASQAGKLVLSIFAPAAASAAKPPASLPCDSVTVTDARGRSQLFHVGGTGPPREAPPLPPAELFDVRLAGDRYDAVATGDARIAVNMQGVVYPLQIGWTGGPAGLRGWSIAAGGSEAELTEAGSWSIAAPTDVALVHAGVAHEGVPAAFRLAQNTPNPFNPQTLLRYSVPARSIVRLDVFSVLGQRIATLVEAEAEPGEHEVVWDARDAAGHAMSSGVYYYRLEAVSVNDPGKAFTDVKRMMLLR
jgi:hypothetical protein